MMAGVQRVVRGRFQAAILGAMRLKWFYVRRGKGAPAFWIAALALLCTVFGAGAQGLTVVLDDRVDRYDLRDMAGVLIDDSAALDIHAVTGPAMAERFAIGGQNVGAKKAAVWMQFTLHNPANQERTWWFDTGTRVLQAVDLYTQGHQSQWIHQSASSNRPFAQRPLPTTDFVFPVVLAPGQTARLLLRVQSTSALAPSVTPILWQPDAYREYALTEKLQWFTYFGACVALALLNLMVFAYLRDFQYGWYVLSLLGTFCLVSFTAGGYGAAYETLIPDSPRLYQVLRSVGVAAGTTAPACFAMGLLNAGRLMPRLQRAILLAGTVLWLIVFLHSAAFLLEHQPLLNVLQRIGPVIAPCIVFIMLGVAVIIAKGLKTSTPLARYFAVAYLPLYFTSVQSVVALMLGWEMHPASIMWASVFELLVMSLALADRFHRERAQKVEAQIALDGEGLRERISILRDMHDGVGSHLSLAIRQVQSDQIDRYAVLLTLRDALDQLKLSIDALNLPTGDITSLLAGIRYRMAPRFSAMGLELEWAVDVLPPISSLDAKAMRQLQFILFEALSNVLQHSKATILRIEALVIAASDGGDLPRVRVRLVDNGCGFDSANIQKGGLATMHERALSIGAQLSVTCQTEKTTVEIVFG